MFAKSQQPVLILRKTNVILRKIQSCFLSSASNKSTMKQLEEFIKNGSIDRSEKLVIYPAQIKSLRVLSSGPLGVGKSLLVDIHHNHGGSILFNCGENTSVIARKFTDLFRNFRNICITSSSWENMSGILETKHGFYPPIDKLTVYGPPKLKEVWPYMDCLTTHCMKLQMIEPSDGSELNLGNGLLLKTLQILSSDEKQDYSFAYVLSSSYIPGSPNREKLKALGISSEHRRILLKEDQSITLKSGQTVHPEDVKTEPLQPLNIIVLEAPSLSHLDSLLKHKGFEPYQFGTSTSENDFPVIVVHFSKQEVIEHPKYQEFVSRFSPSTYHLVLNNSEKCASVRQTYEYLKLRRKLWPNVFPVLYDETINQPAIAPIPGTLIHGLVNLKFDPIKQEFSCKSCRSATYELDVSKQFPDSQAQIAYQNHQDALSKLESPSNRKEFPKVVFLGTGSATCSLERGVAGILINACSAQHALLDCGIGTLGQLVRLYGPEKSKQILMDTSLVFVSHHHSDHHLGLITFLLERQNAFKSIGEKIKPCYVLTGNLVEDYLRAFQVQFTSFENVHLIRNHDIRHLVRSRITKEFHAHMRQELGVHIELCHVLHTAYSFGISITHEDGWKIVYSGDTIPNKNLTTIGMNCDILIHEATYEDNMKSKALKSMHSTISDAIEMGKIMKAKKTILTHFGYLYDMIPNIHEQLPDNVGIAYDFATFDINPDPQMKLFYPTLNTMVRTRFSSRYEENSLKETITV